MRAGFFRMELHAESVTVRNNRTEFRAALSHRERVRIDRSIIGMCEIKIRSAHNPGCEEIAAVRRVHRVPPDMRDLYRLARKLIHCAGQDSETFRVYLF